MVKETIISTFRPLIKAMQQRMGLFKPMDDICFDVQVEGMWHLVESYTWSVGLQT